MTTSWSSSFSLSRLLEPETLADPYPLYRQLRETSPVFWDPYLHAFVVTRYDDVLTVLHEYSAARAHAPAELEALGLGHLTPIASVMLKQMLFLDGAAHRRVRRLASLAFTPRRVELLSEHLRDIAASMVSRMRRRGAIDVMADLANPLPGIVSAEMLGVPVADHERLKRWSQDFAEMLGNFQQNPGRTRRVLQSLEEMSAYFRSAIRHPSVSGGDGLINALATTEADGERLSEDDVIANLIIIMVGGQETTSNLIGNGLLTLLRHPRQAQRLRDDPSLIPSAVEEMLRYESPVQHTGRLAPAGAELSGVRIRPKQGVIAMVGAANRDPAAFADPDTFDVGRADDRHVAFGWSAHFCFGASLARLEAQAAFEALLDLPELVLQPGELEWRFNLGLRGLKALPVTFAP